MKLDARELGFRGEDLVPCDFNHCAVFHCAEHKPVIMWSFVLNVYRPLCSLLQSKCRNSCFGGVADRGVHSSTLVDFAKE